MDPVAHRRRPIRDQIIDREVRRLELRQRAKRDATTMPSLAATPGVAPDSR